MRQIGCLLVCVLAVFLPAKLAAQEARPRSILVLDDGNAKSPFYYEAYSSLRAVVSASVGSPVNLYTESLDLTRFRGGGYEEGLQQLFKVKYRDRPIGVIVTIGSSSLEHVLAWRGALWPDVPVAFTMVDEP